MLSYRNLFWFALPLTLLMDVLTACGSSIAPTGPRAVQVTLSEFKITSSVTAFAPGTSYHFVVINNGKIAHEFMIMPMGLHMEHLSMDEMHTMALHMFDKVAPGETKTFAYTFKPSTVGQHLEFACHLPGHYEAGMRLPITVTTQQVNWAARNPNTADMVVGEPGHSAQYLLVTPSRSPSDSGSNG